MLMQKRAPAWVLGGWMVWAVPGGIAEAQPQERPAEPAPVLELRAADDEPAVALDPADGAMVIGGAETLPVAGCGPASRAFVARLDGDGRELWRREASELFAAAAGFEAPHVQASAVRALTVDPSSGRIFALGDAFLGWLGDSCPGGIAGGRDAFVVALAPDGTPVGGTLLGAAPAGPPAAAGIDCAALCAPPASSWLAGAALDLALGGELSVTGRRRDGRGALPPHYTVHRLSRDLRLLGRPQDVVAKSGMTPVGCGSATNSLVRLESLEDTSQEGTIEGMLARDDGDVVVWQPSLRSTATAEPEVSFTYGFEAEYQIGGVTNLNQLVFDLVLSEMTVDTEVEMRFYLMRLDGGRDLIDTRVPEPDGRIDTAILGSIVAEQPSSYLDPTTCRVVAQVEIVGLLPDIGLNCEDTHGDYGGGYAK